jgi:hypothetical protein
VGVNTLVLGLSASAYGFGAGIFFLAYSVFEVPSNLLLAHFGARRWIARIMFTWGITSGAMALIGGEAGFYVVRSCWARQKPVSRCEIGCRFLFGIWAAVWSHIHIHSRIRSTSLNVISSFVRSYSLVVRGDSCPAICWACSSRPSFSR